MSTIHLEQTTTATPEQFVAELTDFGPGRRKLFGNSADEHLKVHNRDGGEADVTEGSGGVWERLHYAERRRAEASLATSQPHETEGRLSPARRWLAVIGADATAGARQRSSPKRPRRLHTLSLWATATSASGAQRRARRGGRDRCRPLGTVDPDLARWM
jgi:hypothetical protein